MNGTLGAVAQQGMMSTSWVGGGGGGMVNAAAPKSPMQAHADTTHTLAGNLQDANNRLSALIDRIVGPCPDPAGGGIAKDQPPPNGALLVAQFGAERINIGVTRLNELLNRLEGIV